MPLQRTWTARSYPAMNPRGSVAARQRVDRDGDGEDERDVLARRDLHPVGLPNAEPALRDRGHRVAVALDLVLVVEHPPMGLHVGAVFDVDREPVSEADQRLVHRRGVMAVPFDRDLVAKAQLALLDPGDFAAGAVLEHEGPAE